MSSLRWYPVLFLYRGSVLLYRVCQPVRNFGEKPEAAIGAIFSPANHPCGRQIEIDATRDIRALRSRHCANQGFGSFVGTCEISGIT